MRMGKVFFLLMLLLFLMISTAAQATKSYYIKVDGKKYSISHDAYELLLDGDAWVASVFEQYGIPFPEDGKFLLSVEDDGNPESQDPVPTQEPTPTSSPIRMAEKTITMLKGDKIKPSLLHYSGKVSWKSKKSSIVRSMLNGRIQAKKTGTTTIWTIINGIEYQCKVKVLSKTESNRIRLVYNKIIKKGMSKRKKIKEVHNWMIGNIKYDYYNFLKKKVPKISHTSKGALLKGVAVCDGYSYAFQKFMKKLKVPCRIVYGYASGGLHAWNKVQIDGKWRYVDVTFDDPIVNGKNTNKKPYYHYFLKTSKQMKRTHFIIEVQ